VRIAAVEVCYLEERPEYDEGPFLREERSLIDAVADQVGRIVASAGPKSRCASCPRS
jgi:hypothetical protein